MSYVSYINKNLLNLKTRAKSEEKRKIIFSQKLKLWINESLSLSKQMLPYIILGVSMGAFIHGFVPQDFFDQYLSGRNILSVPFAALAGIPLYASSISIIPIIEATIQKGMPLGTALAFMTSIVTLSIPQALMLKKIMQTKLLIMFFSITTIGIMIIGFLFNFLY